MFDFPVYRDCIKSFMDPVYPYFFCRCYQLLFMKDFHSPAARHPCKLFLRHGDMLYMVLEERINTGSAADGNTPDAAAISSVAVGVSNLSAASSSDVCVEDEVDQILGKQDGKIYRSRNDQL